MHSTLLKRLLAVSSLALAAAGCGGTDPAPKRVLSQETTPPATNPAAGEPGDGATLFGGPIGGRLVPRQKTLQQTAVDTLARIGAPSVPALVAMLHDPDPVLRVDAARALAKMGNEATPATAELIAALSDEDEEVRKNATQALGEIGPAASEAIPALIDELRASAKRAEAEAAAARARQPAKGGFPEPLPQQPK